MVIHFGHHPLDAGGDNHFGADVTRHHFAIYCGAVQADTEAGRLHHRVLFRVRRADTVHRLATIFIDNCVEVMPYVVAVRQPWRRTDVASGNNSFISGNHATAPAPVAGSSSTYIIRHSNEVFVPGRPRPLFTNFLHPFTISQLILFSKPRHLIRHRSKERASRNA